MGVFYEIFLKGGDNELKFNSSGTCQTLELFDNKPLAPPYLFFHLSSTHLWLLAISLKLSCSFWFSSVSHKTLVSHYHTYATGYRLTTTSRLYFIFKSSRAWLYLLCSVYYTSKSLLQRTDLLLLCLYHIYVSNLCLHLLFKFIFLDSTSSIWQVKIQPYFQ